MRFTRPILVILFVWSAIGVAPKTTPAQEQKPAPSHVHYIAPKQQTVSPTGAIAPRLQKLGDHKFPVSTKNAQAQAFFEAKHRIPVAFGSGLNEATGRPSP